MNNVGEVRDWLLAQLLDSQTLAQRHGFSEVAQALDEILDLLSEPTAAEKLEPPQVLPFRRT